MARRVFILGFASVQVFLIATADARPDRVFGFRMFNESSSLRFDLFRRISRGQRTLLVPVKDGGWQVSTAAGQRSFNWTDRVRYRALSRPGVFVHATYGLDAQLFRLQAALKDVSEHLEGDPETRALVARVQTRKNGRTGPNFEYVATRPEGQTRVDAQP